jgi:EAL domain-containing protein (putative c-di-GMP-specific phosphodiesterase class I)
MEIAGALDEHRVALAFQTVAPTKAGVAGFEEALLRVVRRDGKVIGPQIVLPVAERLGLSRRLDERVLDIAIERLATDRSRRLSVNICASALRSRVWLDRLMGRLEDCPGVGERLILEILETQAIEDVEATARAIRKIKRLGVRIAMDDFGAGHTSFRNLRELGVDIVKIDGAFVQNLARSQDDRFFVRTLAALARHLGIETVAEWVEDEEAIALLTRWGIDYLQGHAIGRPKFSAEIETPRRALSARKRAAA